VVTEIFLHDNNVFWDLTPFAWQKFTDVFEAPAPSIFLIGTSEIWGQKEEQDSAG
jgi:hypothetical protein